MTSKEAELRTLKVAVGTYALVFSLKLAAYFATGVMALLAEALHTLSDIFVSGFLLAALIWSRREADTSYMFGYGRAQNVAALVAATLFISFTSLRLYEEAIPRLFRPGEATYQNLPLALGVLALSMVLAAIPLTGLFRQKKKGAAAKAQMMELFNDEAGLMAALVGTLFLMQGYQIADPIASIIVATIIAINAIGLFKDNIGLLMGRSPGPEFMAKVERTALSVKGVLGVHDMKAEYVGPDTIHTGFHIEVAKGTPIEKADRIAEEVKAKVSRETGCQHCVIHIDPARKPAKPKPE